MKGVLRTHREIRYVVGVIAILAAIALLMTPYGDPSRAPYGGTSLVLLSLAALLIVLILTLVITNDKQS